MLYKLLQYFLFFVLSLGMLCSEALADVKPNVVELNQGWSKEEIQFYNNASEGTNLAPLEFVFNLRDAANPRSKFIDTLSSKYGLIPGEQSDLNPFHLPVGLAIDERPKQFGDRPYLGLACAACHTRQLTYSKTDSPKAKQTWILPVHGGPSLANIPLFLDDLYSSFFALLQDDTLMQTFATDVLQRTPGPEDIDSLRQEILEITGPVSATKAIIDKLQVARADFGPGNLNALTRGNYNNVGLGAWLVKKGLLQPSDTPPLRIQFEGSVNYPPTWFSVRDTWAQWFAEIHHPGQRNWVQSVSSSPVRPPKMIEALKEKVILASIDFNNIEKIQDSLERLRPPKWPENALGKLDQKLIAQGKPLFEENCAQCHLQSYEPPNSLGIKFKKRLAFDVGTDPVAYLQFKENAPKRATDLLNISNKMLQLRQTQLTKQYGEEIAENYIKHDSRGRPNKFGLAQEEYYNGEPNASWEKSGAVYWASPMQGIFASSPYFHNGSVPTLEDILSPPEQRPTTFRTGTNKFEPKSVGLKNEGPFIYDTQELGKGNGGHLYGTDLLPARKTALIEYLKSL